MSDARPARFREPAPGIEPSLSLRTSAGSPVTATLHVTNHADEPRVIALTTMGVDADWLPRPTRSRPVLPGETIAADLTLCPSIGTLPARYPLAVAVQALEPYEQKAVSPVAVCDVELIVDAPGRVAVTVQPAAPSAVFGRRVTAVLHNAGPQPEAVDIEVREPHSIRVSFPPGPVLVPPGASVPVRGRARVARPRLAGRAARHGYTVTARTSGAPRHAEAALVARPVLGPLGVRATVIIAVIAVWAALAAIFIPKLADKVRNQALGTHATSTTTTGAAAGGAGGSGHGGHGTSSGRGSGAGGAGSGSGGSGGSGAGGSGGGGSGAGGAGGHGAGGSLRHHGAPATAAAVQLNGTVQGTDPSGVSVSLVPTSLVDEQAQGATEVGFSTDSGPVAKLTAAAVVVPPAAAATRRTVAAPQLRKVVTGPDGAWSFPRVSAPGYYLVTFAKPGYQTQRYVIDSSAATANQPLQITLQPGEGHLSGTVRGADGAHGAVGAATVTISDGTNTVTTSSNSKGDVGSWSVSGLSTPGSYLDSISHDGMATESRLVTLAAGGSATVDLSLPVGLASLVGTVQGMDENGQLSGLGGAQVTVTDGTITRTATTVTTGGSLVGSYTLPDLPPGTYTVTIADQGFLTQSRQVVLRPGRSQLRQDATLTSATGVVSGTVRFGASVPDPAQPGQFLTGPIAGAGLVLSSSDNTYKITSEGDGSYRFTGVVPGTYVLSAQYSGMQTGYLTVSVQAGQTTSGADFALVALVPNYTATIAGAVSGALNSSGRLVCPADDSSCTSIDVTLTLFDMSDPHTDVNDASTALLHTDVPASAVGPTNYTLPPSGGLQPGLYRLDIGAVNADTKTAEYLPATVNVNVPLNAVASAPAVTLHTANSVSGTITALGDMTADGPANSAAGEPPYRNCVWAEPVDASGGFTHPSDCGDAATASKPPSGCTDSGAPQATFAPLQLDPQSGTYPYRVSGLCDGIYEIVVVITNPWYIAPAPPASQEVSGGHTVAFSSHVSRLGHLLISMSELDPGSGSTGPLADKSLTGSVRCGGTSVGDLHHAPNGVVEVDGVPTGTVSCTASGTDASQRVFTGTISSVSAPTDQDSQAAMTLNERLGAAVGRVVSTYNGVTHPVGPVRVTVTGTVDFDGTAGTSGTVTVTTDADGCFAITPDGSGATVPGAAHCASVAAANAGALDLKSARVTLSVDGTDTTPARLPGDFSLAAGSVAPVEVGALPASIGALALKSQPAGADLSGATITVTKAPLGAGHVDASADSDGQLHWRDRSLPSTQQAADAVVPGEYTVSVMLTGYRNTTAGLSCAPAADCTVTSGSLTLAQLAGLRGHITGLLATAPSPGALHEFVNGAKVTAVPCSSLTTCPDAPSASDAAVSTDNQGSYTFAGLQPGDYELVVSASGYHSATSQPFTLSAGTGNADQDVQLAITLVTLNVHLRVGSSASDFTHASVTLTRADTGESTTVSAASGGVFAFPGLVPATYFYDVTGDGSSAGDSVQETRGTVPVPRDSAVNDSDNAASFSTTIIASTARTSVAGQVVGPVGPNPSAPLGGVTVAMQHLVDGDWQPANDVNGHALQTTTATDGTYRLTGVPHDPAYKVTFSKTGYLDASSAQFAAAVGDTLFLGAQTLTRVTHNVLIKITVPQGDNITAATPPVLTSQDFSGFTFTGGTANYVDVQTLWTFNQVPFGCWTFDIKLQGLHFGTLTQTSGSGSCSNGFEVPATPDTSSDPLEVDFNLAEYRPSVSIALTPIDGDTAPNTVSITVTNDAGDQLFVDQNFPVSATVLNFWASENGGLTVSMSVGRAGWPDDQQRITSGAPTAGLSSTETGVDVSVHVTVGGAELSGSQHARVVLLPPSGITYTTRLTADATQGTVTFTHVPAVMNWQAQATLIGASVSSSPTGTSATFDVTANTPTQTVDIPNP